MKTIYKKIVAGAEEMMAKRLKAARQELEERSKVKKKMSDKEKGEMDALRREIHYLESELAGTNHGN